MAPKTKHGHALTGQHTATYRSWKTMKARCQNPKNNKYKDYGAKGVTVCSRWETFENFLLDMGERPANRTLDRKDGTKGYEPSNCRWATPKTQARQNRRMITHNDISQSLGDWASQAGIKRETLAWRINRGLPMDQALHPGKLPYGTLSS